MGFAACGEQDVRISLVSAALPLEMEGFTPGDTGAIWGCLCPPLFAGGSELLFCVVGAAPPPPV